MNYAASSSMKLFLWDKVFQTANSLSAAAAQARERDAVLSTVKRLLGKGVRINRGNGSGQKPRDVAHEVLNEHGLSVTGARVLEILNAAERSGELRYQAGHGKQRAGYILPDDGMVGSP
jgi:hypothetical protein